MEKGYHITLTGLVQGVGFRPYVHQLANQMGINGWISNNVDGVHIEIIAGEEKKDSFLHTILDNPPTHAEICGIDVMEVGVSDSSVFFIKDSLKNGKPSLLLSPDISTCSTCREELHDPNNLRFNYPFATCLKCGPRFSIIKDLPYDRPNTSMQHLSMCEYCWAEYNSINNRRYYSQTNSCPSCAIQMHLFDNAGKQIEILQNEIIQFITGILKEGKIAAVKGIGGYLLLCDACNSDSIKLLRQRKHRPAKPFALIYPSIEMLEQDVDLNNEVIKQLQNHVAPIVLLPLKNREKSTISVDDIAPGLDKIGAMLPYSPLLLLIAEAINAPLVATSGNLSGSPIIYKDDEALEKLSRFADYILCFDREIETPQDDSVIQFTSGGNQKIILRRSRGLAPNYIHEPFRLSAKVLAMGSELKSSFAVFNEGNFFISQFLGNMESFDSQQALEKTLSHYLHLYNIVPEIILVDSHPGYSISSLGRQFAQNWKIPVIDIQHHKAHFAAVLGENNLMDQQEKILGVIWDGTGYGDDGNIWGGEFFTYCNGNMERVGHLNYFKHLSGDKMSREPRLSALALFGENEITQSKFSSIEYKVFKSSLKDEAKILTSSMGRLLDAVASILNVCDYNSYEGEAAIKLEALAITETSEPVAFYQFKIENGNLGLDNFISGILNDIKVGIKSCLIAKKVFFSLVKMVAYMAEEEGAESVAFSGGVFQNALLVEMLVKNLGKNYSLYFHKELSPNDECIGFGQLAYYYNQSKKNLNLKSCV